MGDLMVSLTFYGGAGEIGGNKILLEDKGVKIYLDFGEGFGFGEEFFYEYLSPRKANGLEVYFEFNLVPKVPKLYSQKMLKLTELKFEKPDIDAVFISHSHCDHTGHLPFLDESIPIYMGHGTKHILDIAHTVYRSFYDVGEHNEINTFKSGDKIKIKHLVIEPIHVEHSIPGAYGYIIHTSKGAVVYTGDFRLHGPMKSMSEEFIKKAAEAKPIALLCEGTRMAYETEKNYTEKDVEDKASEIIKKSKGLVMAYWSMTGIDRFKSFYNAAIKNKRILVIDPRLAYIIDNLKEKIELPDVMTDKNIKVYFRLEKSCNFDEMDYKPIERKYCPRMVNYEELTKNPKKYVLHLGFNRLMELCYLKPKNSDFIFSMSEHFLEGEENEEEKEIWENWMQHFGIKFHKAHCSGHASKQDIIETVKKISPKILIPIHTQSPEEFRKIHNNVKIMKNLEVVNL